MNYLTFKTKLRFIIAMLVMMLTPLVQANPGGVSSNLQLWLKADVDATGGTWDDQSLNNLQASQGTGASQPSVVVDAMNFNPALNFDGTDDFMNLNAFTNFPTGNNARTVITVAKPFANNDGPILSYGRSSPILPSGEICALFDHDSTTSISWSGYLNGYNEAAVVWSTVIPNIVIANYDNTNISQLYVNGQLGWTHTFVTPWNTDLSTSPAAMIGKHIFVGQVWKGHIAEIILYDKVLNVAETQQVNSYLAIKYGITLDSTINYVNSSGTAIYPSTGSHSGYINDIAGIGTGSGLSQPKSRSVNTDSVVTIAGSGIANGNFLIWGNDDGTLTFSSIEVPSNIRRFAREWKVAETGETGTTTLMF
ncbi:hypothetical protein QUF74_05255 [Candidatus Halobeggiatoa sp. HSG11]|nr:hypothetical protein [Candidatus Halobeggiatoa sp. HSG11]